jgi:type IV secretory pathway VirB4 component
MTAVRARRTSHRPSAGASWLGPGGIEVHPRYLEIDGVFAATLTVTGYPETVLPGWLEAITTYPARIDLALHAEAIAPMQAATRLRKQRARLESGRRRDAERGRLGDPMVEAAAQDAAELAGRIARSSAKLFKAALHLTVYAESPDELDVLVEEVRGLLAAQLATVTPATYRQHEGWISTLPLGIDRLGPRRTLETEALAACLPIASPDLPVTASGVLAGVNTTSGLPVFWDRWAQQNHNSLTLGSSGSGKSFFAKCDLLRELYQGTHAAVIDPDGEYTALAKAVGGVVLELGKPGVRINPLELPDPTVALPDTLARKALDVHALVEVLAGAEAARDGRAVLDTAIAAAYEQAGITADPRTWNRQAPDLTAVRAVLESGQDAAAMALASALGPFTGTGSHAGLFDAPSTHGLTGHLTVYTLEHLPEQLRPAAVLLVLTEVWRQAQADDGRRRLALIDEAWLLLNTPLAAELLFRLAKSARKHHAGLALVSQDADDLLSSRLGTAVAANCATQVLMRQAPQTLDQVAEAFHLSRGESRFLASAPRGNALITGADGARATVVSIAADDELVLLRTGLSTT